MPSAARTAFEENIKDVERLLEIHGELTGEGPGYKHGVEVLNKSAVVLMTAVWEAYCEDLAAEAVEHLVENGADADSLPKKLRRQIADELKSDNNNLAIWQVSGDGWRQLLRQRLSDLQDQRNRDLNTPKARNIGQLFENAVGLPGVPEAWSWKGISADQAARKLDGFVSLRGDIAHRGAAANKIKKGKAQSFIEHAQRLVEATDNHVNEALENACGVPLF